MKHTACLRYFLALAGSSLLTLSSAHAASGTWNGTTSALWNLDSNWSAAFPITGNTATFNNAGGGNTTIDLGAGASVTTLNFDTANAAAYTIGLSGQNLTLGAATGNPAGTISMASTVVNNQVFDANLIMGNGAGNGTYVLTNNSSSLLTINGGITSTNTGNKTLNVNGTGNTVLNGVLDRGTAGSFFVQKNTAGSTLTLGGSSSNLNLTLNVNAGTVELNKSGAANAVSTGTVVVGGGSTLQYNASAGSDQIANGLTVTLAGTAGLATLNLNGASDTISSLTFFGNGSTSTSQGSVTTGAGILTIDGGSVTVNNNTLNDRGTATISGFLDVGTSSGMNGGRRNFNVADGAAVAVDLEVSAVISSSAGAFGVRKIGAGTMRLTGANTYDGATVIDSGTVEVTNVQDGGTASSLGDSSNAASNILFVNDGRILRYVGSADATTNRAFTLSTTGTTSSSVIESSGEGTLSFTNNAVLNAYGTNRTLVLGGTNTGANTFGKIISSSTTLNKEGPGTWVLTETNTHTGATNVNGGTLILASTGSTAAGSAVKVASGAILGGNGTVGGTVNVSGGIAPGTSGIGTLNVGSTTWNGAAVAGAATDWKFNLGASNTEDSLNITGNFSKDITAGSVFRFDFLNSAVAGTFDLVTWSGANGFSAGDFSFTNLGAGYSGSFNISGNTLQFTSVIPEPSTALAGILLGLGLLRRRRA